MIFSLTIFVHIKMSLYRFYRQELLQKVKDRYHNGGGKKESTEYYIANKDVLKEKSKNNIKTCHKKKKKQKETIAKIGTKTFKKKQLKDFYTIFYIV